MLQKELASVNQRLDLVHQQHRDELKSLYEELLRLENSQTHVDELHLKIEKLHEEVKQKDMLINVLVKKIASE